MKNIFGLIVVFLMSILVCSFVSAGSITMPINGEDGAEATIYSVEVNDVDLNSIGGDKDLRKTDTLDILVVFSINKSIDDVTIEAELTGYDKSDRDKVTDTTDTFDVKANDVYDKRLKLELPPRFRQGTYSLKIRIDTPKGTLTKLYDVKINTKEHLIEIRDIILSPENEVKAGRALLASVRVKNRGERKEEDIKVKVSIPALGISASDYIDELDSECNDEDEDCDDSTTSEELYMRIPDCADPGEYTLKAVVEYDDGDEEVVDTRKITVIKSDTCVVPEKEKPATGRTIIAIGPETQEIQKGSSVVYPITITNDGTESRVYSISLDYADWATFSITPTNTLVIDPGESKTAYINVVPKATAVVGQQVFSVTVKSGENILKQVPLKATITEAAGRIGISTVKKALEIGLVILVILLVILGLIIGFSKIKGSKEEESKEEQTYY